MLLRSFASFIKSCLDEIRSGLQSEIPMLFTQRPDRRDPVRCRYDRRLHIQEGNILGCNKRVIKLGSSGQTLTPHSDGMNREGEVASHYDYDDNPVPH